MADEGLVEGLVEALGDVRDAACYGLDKDKTPPQSAPHTWQRIIETGPNALDPFHIDICGVCGGFRRVYAWYDRRS